MDVEDLNARVGAQVPNLWLRKASEPPAGSESPIDVLHRIGVTRTPDGGFHLSPDALQRIRDDRMRRATVSRVPSTQRWVPREGGGVGVRKGAGRWDILPMETLRRVRETGMIFQAIHAARATQMRRMSVKWTGVRGSVGWRVVHKDFQEVEKTPPKSIQPYIDRFEELLRRPALGLCDTTGQLFQELEEDLLTINRPVVEKLVSIFDAKRVIGFRPVDGAIIWSTNHFLEKWLADNPRWYGNYNPSALNDDDLLDIVCNIVGHDVKQAEYCLVRDGILENTYAPGRLIVAPSVNRTDVNLNGYCPSNVEMAMEIGLTFINTWNYNASFFTRGMMAEFILGVTGDVHDDDIDAFSDMLREASQGVGRAWQPPIMPLPENGAITKIDLKAANRDMMYETFLSLQVALAGAIYRMDPSTINAKPWDGGSSPSLSAPNREQEIALAKEEGLQGDLQHLIDSIFNPLAQGCHPDLRVILETGDFDPQKEATIYEIRARTSMTRNEVRLAEGKKPKGFWVTDDAYGALSDEDKKKYDANPWNMPTDPGFAQVIAQQAQQEQQEKMMAQQQQQPQHEDGYGGEQTGADDGYGGGPPASAPFGGPGAPGGGGSGGGGPGGPGGAPPPQAGAPNPPPIPGAAPLRKAVTPGRITVFVQETPSRR